VTMTLKFRIHGQVGREGGREGGRFVYVSRRGWKWGAPGHHADKDGAGVAARDKRGPLMTDRKRTGPCPAVRRVGTGEVLAAESGTGPRLGSW
jgi:hypothetical protein